MQAYVLGFVFDLDYKHVLLVRKNRPFWQKGFLNGVGGHIEGDESAYEAMCRECLEESNLELYNWLYIGEITDNSTWLVNCYSANVSNFDDAKSLTDELIEVVSMRELDYEQLVRPADILLRLATGIDFMPIKLSVR